MDENERVKFREQLHDLRAELQALAATGDASSGTVQLDQSRVGRLSRMDALQAQAMSQASGRRRAATLQRIERALQRIDAEEFGDCLDCDEPIAVKRLEFDPTAERCVRCAERNEQR